jgi:K(+)-stimulated pyrophosphate-energized sodium pump
MRKIGAHVRVGAMAYLRQQYKIMLVVFALVAGPVRLPGLRAAVQNPWLPITFVFGGFFSALAGYFGMQTATWRRPAPPRRAPTSLAAH